MVRVAWWVGLCSPLRTQKLTSLVWDVRLEQLLFQQDVWSLKLGCGKVVMG